MVAPHPTAVVGEKHPPAGIPEVCRVRRDFVRDEVRSSIFDSPFLGSNAFGEAVSQLGSADGRLSFESLRVNSYFALEVMDATEINASRARNRAALGGHAVPEDKIASRYHCSLDWLVKAIRLANRAYIFDNLTDSQTHTSTAKIKEGHDLELKINQIPAWFLRAVLEKS